MKVKPQKHLESGGETTKFLIVEVEPQKHLESGGEATETFRK